MKFGVYRCKKDPHYFVVTDAERAGELRESWCPRGGELEKVGEYPEIGAQRVAFDETVAKHAIAQQGFYRFKAKTPAAVPAAPETRS